MDMGDHVSPLRAAAQTLALPETDLIEQLHEITASFDVVATELGFATPNNFRREFLGFYQVPPLRFQQEAWGEKL